MDPAKQHRERDADEGSNCCEWYEVSEQTFETWNLTDGKVPNYDQSIDDAQKEREIGAIADSEIVPGPGDYPANVQCVSRPSLYVDQRETRTKRLWLSGKRPCHRLTQFRSVGDPQPS